MSTSKGSTVRRRPQKHQNRTAFKNDLHDTSQRTKFLNKLQVSGVCKRCKGIIDWKIKYKKYKMISAPKKCVGCEQKAVNHAYHILCGKCAREKDVCAKCCKKIEIDEEDSNLDNPDQAQVPIEEVVAILKPLPERKRRTILRFINKHHEGEQKISTETMSHIQKVLAKMDSLNLDEDGFSDDEEDADSEN